MASFCCCCCCFGLKPGFCWCSELLLHSSDRGLLGWVALATRNVIPPIPVSLYLALAILPGPSPSPSPSLSLALSGILSSRLVFRNSMNWLRLWLSEVVVAHNENEKCEKWSGAEPKTPKTCYLCWSLHPVAPSLFLCSSVCVLPSLSSPEIFEKGRFSVFVWFFLIFWRSLHVFYV